jgi:hypothetical protein
MTRFQDALAQLSRGDFQSVYDISKAYHHVRLHPDSYQLVGFCVEDENRKEEFYHYVVMVFGLGPAGQVLGRVMRPIPRFLTNAGVRNIVYVDDGRVAASDKSKADADYRLTIATFMKAGLVVAVEKSDKFDSSAQRKEYLGFIIDTGTMSVEVPELKMKRVKSILLTFLKSPKHKVREVASVLGKLIALEPALGKSVLVGTRLATIAIVAATEVSEGIRHRRKEWEEQITLDMETMTALSDVASSLDIWNGFPIQAWHTGISLSSILPAEATASLDRKIPARRVDDRRAIMASNASDFAVALYSVEGLPEFSFSAALELSEKGESSSFRELIAIIQTLEHVKTTAKFLQPPEWKTLWWLTDNSNVEKFLSKGSGKLKITRLALQILKIGRELKFDVQPIWVSRDNPFLQKADCLLKGIDSDNWEVKQEDFECIEGLFGPFSIDLFATSANAKCVRLYARSFESGALGVDCFAQKWAGECVYAATPVSLIMRTIRKAAISVNINGSLLVPLWKGAKFWTFAYRDGVHLNGIFADMQLVRMRTLSWDISRKDRVGAKICIFCCFVLARFAKNSIWNLCLVRADVSDSFSGKNALCVCRLLPFMTCNFTRIKYIVFYVK